MVSYVFKKMNKTISHQTTEFLIGNGHKPSYLLTVNYYGLIHSKSAIKKTTNLILLRLSRKILGRRAVENRGQFLDMVAVLESTKSQNPHFHILIREPIELLNAKGSFKALVNKELHRLKHYDKLTFLTRSCVDIREIANTDEDHINVANYLIKDLPLANEGTFRNSEHGLAIGFSSEIGFCWGVDLKNHLGGKCSLYY